MISIVETLDPRFKKYGKIGAAALGIGALGYGAYKGLSGDGNVNVKPPNSDIVKMIGDYPVYREGSPSALEYQKTHANAINNNQDVYQFDGRLYKGNNK